ncbi:MAG TPA: glycosyltransferase family 39 protein, partial [Acidimicrobiales bacterium]|nr:glycosyltransferase family 39 protein [Acidimicrobiales bacterium]
SRVLGAITRLGLSISRPTSLVVMASMVVGGAIRLDVPRGLWLDEAISVSEAKMPYGAMLHRLATTDVHPPLYFTVLWASIRLIGVGDFAVRVPSIWFGIVLIPLVYLLGKEAYDRRTGAVAAVLVAVGPYTVWYSQEARMYAMLMVFSVLALWAQVRIFHRGGWYPWVIYTLASVAMIATQYFGMWQLLVQQLVFVGAIVVRFHRRERPGRLLRAWLFSAVPLVLALIPLGLMMKGQFTVHQATGQAFGGTATATVAGGITIYSVITNFGYAAFGFHSNVVMSDVISLWPFIMLGALAMLGRRATSVTYLFAAAVAVPVGVMFVLGQFQSSLGDVRYVSTIVPVLFLLIARGITGVARKNVALTAVVVAIVAVMAVALFDQQFSSSNPRRYNFREAIARVDAHARPGDTILYDPVNSQLSTVFAYYSPKIKYIPLTTKPTVKAGHSVFIVASSQIMNPSDQTIYNRALGFLNFQKHPTAHWVFPNVQVWEYR